MPPQTRPDIASKLGEIQVQLSKPMVSTLLEANKVLHEAQQTEDVGLCFRSISPQQLTHVVFDDASFCKSEATGLISRNIGIGDDTGSSEEQESPN